MSNQLPSKQVQELVQNIFALLKRADEELSIEERLATNLSLIATCADGVIRTSWEGVRAKGMSDIKSVENMVLHVDDIANAVNAALKGMKYPGVCVIINPINPLDEKGDTANETKH